MSIVVLTSFFTIMNVIVSHSHALKSTRLFKDNSFSTVSFQNNAKTSTFFIILKPEANKKHIFLTSKQNIGPILL